MGQRAHTTPGADVHPRLCGSGSNVVHTWGSARASREDTHPRCVNAGAGYRGYSCCATAVCTQPEAVRLLVAAGRLQGRVVLPGWVVAVPTLSGLVQTERPVCR